MVLCLLESKDAEDGDEKRHGFEKMHQKVPPSSTTLVLNTKLTSPAVCRVSSPWVMHSSNDKHNRRTTHEHAVMVNLDLLLQSVATVETRDNVECGAEYQ